MFFSKIISVIFHPVFMPLLAFLLTINISQELNNQLKQANCLSNLVFVIIISSCLLPVFFVAFLKRIGWINSIYLHLRKDRIFPLFFSAISLYSGILCLQSCLDSLLLLRQVFLSFAINIFVAMVISFFWKISLHMLSVGGVLGAIISVGTVCESDKNKIIVVVIVLMILVLLLGFARIKEKAHDKLQVILGFLIGLTLVSLFILSKNNISYLNFSI